MTTQLVLDALEQAVWTRQRTGAALDSVVAHTDRGSQYVSIRYTERLAEAGIAASVGTVGDSYDNALAETINGLYKTELIKPRGPWRTADAVEYATAEWVDWFNHRRLYEYCGDIPPAEAEDHYYAHKTAQPTAELSRPVSLRTSPGRFILRARSVLRQTTGPRPAETRSGGMSPMAWWGFVGPDDGRRPGLSGPKMGPKMSGQVVSWRVKAGA